MHRWISQNGLENQLNFIAVKKRYKMLKEKDWGNKSATG